MNNNGGTVSWKTCVRLAITVLALFLCVRYWDAVEGIIGLLWGGLTAIFAGLIIAYVVNIPLRFFERKLPGETGDGTRNRMLSLALATVCIVAVFLFVNILVIPQLVQAIITLAQEAPTIISGIANNDFIKPLIPEGLLTQIQSVDWQKTISDAFNWLQTGLMSSLPQITSAIGLVGACFMGVVLAFWFLAEKNQLSQQVHNFFKYYIGPQADVRFTGAIAVADKCFRGYIVGQSMEAAIFGSIVAVVSGIAGLPYAPMLGALVGAMSLIPMVGAIIGAVLGAFIIAVTSWQQALIFLIVFLAVQQVEANFIYPRVVGKQVGLTGMWPLIGITLGTALLGFAGAFVGVPITAAVFRIVEADLERRELNPEGAQTPLSKLHESLKD